jgi:RNA polymerase sigma-70 factor (ECF subfamily)
MDGPELALPVPVRRDPMTEARASFDALLLARLDRAYRLAAVILGSAIEAEDAVADAGLAAWRSFPKLREPERFEAWFERIVVNVCRDRLRSRRRAPVVEALSEPAAGPIAPGDFRDVIHTRDELARAFERLDPDARIVLTLRFWADLPVAAMADRLGVPEGTVKSRLHHATAQLRAVLGGDEGDR